MGTYKYKLKMAVTNFNFAYYNLQVSTPSTVAPNSGAHSDIFLGMLYFILKKLYHLSRPLRIFPCSLQDR